MDEIIPQNANFFEKMTACFGDLSQFEQKIQKLAEIAQIDLTALEIDHLAVRMNEIETAKQWRTLLLENAQLLKESEVNGRPIALFELTQAVDFAGQNVKVIELPFPKGKTYPEEGWEHIEAVFPMRETENIPAWIARTLAAFQLENNPQIQLKISQPEVKDEQLANPTIAITAQFETLCYNVCLKLHPYTIKSVISSETP